MHNIAYLNFHRARLEAFRTGELFDVNLIAAPTFEQPVAFTKLLRGAVSPGHGPVGLSGLKLASQITQRAHRELVEAARAGTTSEPVTVDFDLIVGTAQWNRERQNLWHLRVMFHFVSDPGSGVTVPAVTIGFTDEFEDV